MLRKIDLNPNDIETAKEYEELLNAFYNESKYIGNKISNSNLSEKKLYIKSEKSPVENYANNNINDSENKYEISTSIGLSFPNSLTLNQTSSGYSPGPNIGIRFNTPLTFKLAKINAKIGTEIFFSSLLPKSTDLGYFSTNIIGNISLFPFYNNENQNIPSIELRPGIGFSWASIGNDQKLSLTFPLDIIYYVDFSRIRLAFSMQFQFTGGNPTGGTASLINFNCKIKTPFKF